MTTYNLMTQSSQNYKETPHKLIKYEQNINYNFFDDKVELSNTISQKMKP